MVSRNKLRPDSLSNISFNSKLTTKGVRTSKSQAKITPLKSAGLLKGKKTPGLTRTDTTKTFKTTKNSVSNSVASKKLTRTGTSKTFKTAKNSVPNVDGPKLASRKFVKDNAAKYNNYIRAFSPMTKKSTLASRN